MPRTSLVEGVVLRAHDVGEADRFLVVFTKELGRVTARAQGARRLGSKLQCTLPSAHLLLTLKESAAGYIVGQAELRSPMHPPSLSFFAVTSQAIELLLQVLQDDDPQPELYASTLVFLRSCTHEPEQHFLAYGLQLLSHLGLLPDEEGIRQFVELEDDEVHFLRCALCGEAPPLVKNDANLRQLLKLLFAQTLSTGLKSPAVAKAML